jgi:hypothetical protein
MGVTVETGGQVNIRSELDGTVETGRQVNIRSELDMTVKTGGQVNIRSELDGYNIYLSTSFNSHTHPTHF